jgi:hypothetical protein
MKSILGAILLAMSAVSIGCNWGASQGPGIASTSSDESIPGKIEDTFSLDLPSAKLKQGETATLPIAIVRGKNFNEDVSIRFGELPKGVTIKPDNPTIMHGDDMEEKLEVKAADDATVGDFTVNVIGHPRMGADVSSELKINVAILAPKDAANSTVEAVKAKRDEFILATQKMLEDLDAKCVALKERAAKAEGDAKKDLDTKVGQINEKRDAAIKKFEELKSAGDEHWETIKDAVGNAFDEMKKILE